jgi:hypothetical protein
MAQDITTWAEMKQVVRELKKPEVKEMFSTIAIDTVDIAATLCEKYVCAQKDVDSISQIPYGQGWTLLKKEFESVFRAITQMGYAVSFISHAKEGTFKRQDGTEYTKIHPSVSTTYNAIIENMADLYGYMHPVFDGSNSKVVITLRSIDGTVSCGGRFKYIEPEIESSYENLVKALNDAIDKEAALTDNKYVTNERDTPTVVTELDYDAEITRFNQVIQKLTEKYPEEDFKEKIIPRITQITDRYLGRGKKVTNCTREQVDMISLINIELEEILAE